MDEETLNELAASIREHGVLQPILVRPLDATRYQLIAGERRWRASRIAGLDTIPALVEEIDDDTALEISIIENLQREDLSPLDEAAMYDRMVREHGYSIRKLADKLGKDKGYLENRLRLADAPAEVRELVSLRKDTLSHAYELMKVDDPKKRRRLAEQVARGELTLVKLRDKIEGRRTPRQVVVDVDEVDVVVVVTDVDDDGPAPTEAPPTVSDGSTDGLGGRPRPDRTDGGLARQRQAASGRGGRGTRRGPAQLRRPGDHPLDGSGEPRQVPDDHEAQAGERHRDGPERRLAEASQGRPPPSSRRARRPPAPRHRRPGLPTPARVEPRHRRGRATSRG